MITPDVNFKIKTASKEEICSHLYCCNENFNPPLNQRVTLEEYSGKIFDKAITFEAWHDKKLIGLVATYLNDPNGCLLGYITHVSVTLDFMGKGIATTLMNNCLEYAQKCGIKNMALKVSFNNNPAISFYEKFGFKKTGTQDDFILMNRSTQSP